MAKRKATATNFMAVTVRLAAFVDGHNKHVKSWFAGKLDEFIDSLLEEEGDFFGTEGQCDPRGDQRD